MAKSSENQPLISKGSIQDHGSADTAPLAVPMLLSCLTALGAVQFGFTLGFTSPVNMTSGTWENSSSLQPHDYVVNKIHKVACKTGLDYDDEAFGVASECWTGLTASEDALFGSLCNVGAMLGAIIGGPLMTAVGRVRTITVSTIPFVVSYLLMYLNFGSSTALVLLVSRVLAGVAVGLTSVSVPVYITEIAPARARGGMGCIFQVGVVIGILYAYAIGIPVYHYKDLALIGVFIPAALFVISLFLPKSPRWLMSKERETEARKALKTIRGSSANVEPELDEVRESVLQSKAEGSAGIGDLFKGTTAKAMAVMAGLMLFQQLSGINCVIFFSGQIFKSAGIQDSNTGALIVGIIQVVVTVISCFIIDMTGRRALLMTAGTGMTSALVVLGFYFFEKNKLDCTELHQCPNGTVAIVAVCLYVAFFSLGLGAIPWLMMGEVFPMKTRSIASSAATMLNWTLSFAVTEAFPYLKKGITDEGTFWLFAGVCVIGVFFVLTCCPETKGQTLETIEKIIAGEIKDPSAGQGTGLVLITAGICSVIAAVLMLLTAKVF